MLYHLILYLVNSPFLLVIFSLFLSQAFLNVSFDIPVTFEAVYRDVKVMRPLGGPEFCGPIGACLMSFHSIWNQVLLSLTVRFLQEIVTLAIIYWSNWDPPF